MYIKRNLIVNLITFFCLFFIVSAAQAYKTNCIPCEDIQHAASLVAIEKRLLEVSDASLLELDDKARCWYEKFQKGGFFYNGWHQISEEVVAKVGDEEKLKARIIMLTLGVKIGCEWSKENDIRKISTSMLRAWGERLNLILAEEPANILVAIHSIEYEVNELLL